MPLCNKCKRGVQQDGDSWCVGCSALELAQLQLGGRWQNPGVRRAAEEVLLSAARVTRALATLDKTLITGLSAGGQTHPVTTAPKTLPAPPPPPGRERSPRRKEDRRDRRKEPSRREETRVEHTRSAGHRDDLPTGDTYSESDFGVEEEEHNETGSARDRKPPEPAGPPPSREETRPRAGDSHRAKQPRKSKKTRRGGVRHQKFWKQSSEPFKQKHRKLSGPVVELAKSFKGGSERRI